MADIVMNTDGGARGNHQPYWETHGFPIPSSTGKQSVFPTPFLALGYGAR